MLPLTNEAARGLVQSAACHLDIEQIKELKQLFIKLGKDFPQASLVEKYKVLYRQLSVVPSDEQLLILYNDTLAICLLRMTQHSLDFIIPLSDMNSIFQHVLVNLDQASSALFNSLNSILSKTLAYINKYYTNDDSICHEWLGRVIVRHSKPSFSILDTLINALHNKVYVIETYPNFVPDLLNLLGNDNIANSVCKPLISVLQAMHVSMKNEIAWTQLWKPAVMVGLSNKSVKTGIVKHFLPRLFQISPSTLHSLIDEVSTSSEENIDLLINLLKIGQDLQIIKYPYKLIAKDLCRSILTHRNSDIRTKALSLILGSSAKNAKSLPVEPEVYEMFGGFHILDIYLNEYENIEVRNTFISLMHSFFNSRFKESMYSLSKRAEIDNDARFLVETGNKFVRTLIRQLTEYLKPSSNYSQMITSLQLLQILLSKLNSSILERLDISNDNKLTTLLIQNLYNDYENVRELCLDVLLLLPLLKLSDAYQLELFGESSKLLSSLVGRKSEGGAKAMEFLFRYYGSEMAKSNDLVSKLVTQISNGLDDNMYVHGHFKSLSLIVKRYEIDQTTREQLLHQIFRVWDVSKLALTTEEISPDQEELEQKEILNYSWKVIKDSNLLLTTLLSRNVLSCQDILQCCDLVMEQIATIKHRGAFQSIYPSFIQLAELCFGTPELNHCPKLWLDKNIELISSKTQYISRRSGGLPYLVTGILVASSNRGKLLLDPAFKQLLAIAQKPFEYIADQRNDIPQVHAFNCLKQIFTDSILGPRCTSYITSCIELSLKNFNVENWSIRNCSMMLFSSIQQRIFRNTKVYPSQVFFKKYPGIHEIFMKHLQNELAGLIQNKNPTVFPILIILLKLDTSEVDNNVKELKEILPKFLLSKYFKIREIAARTIASMLSVDELYKFSESFFNQKSTDANYLHGCVITILEGLKKLNKRDMYILKLVLEHITEYSSNYIVFNYYIQIILTIVKRNELRIEEQYKRYLGNYIIDHLEDKTLNGGKQMALSSIFELLLYQYEHSNQEDFIDLIKLGLNMNFKVQFQIFDVLKSIPTSEWADSHDEIWRLIENPDTWNYVKSRALSAYSQLLSDKSRKASLSHVSTLFELAESNIEDIQLHALLCLASLVDLSQAENFVDLCESHCKDTNPYEKKYTAVCALVTFSKRFFNQKIASRSILTLYVFGLNNEDENIREITCDFFNWYFKFDIPLASTYLRFESVKLLPKMLNNDVAKNKILSILITQSEFIDKYNNSLYGMERDNLFKNEIELVTCLIAMAKQMSCTDSTLSPYIPQLCNLIHRSISLIDNNGDDGLVGWSRDEFKFVPVVRATIISKTILQFSDDKLLRDSYQLLTEKLAEHKLHLIQGDYL